MKVLVRSIGLPREDHDDCYDLNMLEETDDAPVFHREHFHMVDLDVPNGKLHRDILPSLACCTSAKSMDIVALDENIYLIGGVRYPDQKRLIKSLEPPPDKANLFYKGCSKIKLKLSLQKDEKIEWDNEVMRPNENLLFPCCASLLGKIYSFGFATFRPEVYDPSVGRWKSFDLANLLEELYVCGGTSIPVIPDPTNSRILFHCRKGISLEKPSLFAFYPATSEWKLLSTEVLWGKSAAVADDVIYFPQFDILTDDSPAPAIVIAFDLLADKQSNILWKDAHVLKDFINHFRRRYCHFKLFSLTDGSVCICSISYEHLSHDETMQSTINLCFLTFTAMRGPIGTNDIILNPLKVQTVVLDSAFSVVDVIPLSI